MGTRELHAFLDGQHAGVFRETVDSREAVFVYDPDYAGTPLSLSLPKNGDHLPNAAWTFLDNLLPDDSDVRKRWARERMLYGFDPFTLLCEYGEDCAGAVSLSPDEHLPHRDADPVVEATDDDIASRIASLTRDTTSWTDPRVRPRMSLAGAQGKFTLARDGDSWFWPTFEVPSTHILKPPSQKNERVEVFEALSLKLANRVGVRAADADVTEFLDQPTFITRRWDRAKGRRLHAEDLNQATGTSTADKYGVRVRDAVRALRPHGLEYRFVEQLAFNVAVGNHDAHAKNYSVLLHGDQVAMSPIYDTVPIFLYTDYDQKMAMAIGRARLTESATEQNWRRLAQYAELDADAVCGVAFPVLNRVRDTMSEIFADAIRGDTVRERLMDRHLARLSRAIPNTWSSAPAVSTMAHAGCGFPMPRAGVNCVLASDHGGHHRSVTR